MPVHSQYALTLINLHRNAGHRLFILFLGMLLLIIVPVIRALSVNRWSLQLTGEIFSMESPSSYPPQPESYAHGYLIEARWALDANKFNMAREIIAPHLENANPIAWDIEAEALYMQNQTALAIQAWEQAGNIHALMEIAQRSINRGDRATAQSAALALYSIEPENYTEYYAERLWAMPASGQAAIDLLKRSSQAYPGSIYQPLWNKLIGKYYLELQEYTLAEKYLRQSILENPEDWEAYRYMGLALINQHQPLDTILGPFHAAAEDPEMAGRASYEAANLLVEIKRYTEADVWFQKALSSEPEQKGWYLARADAMRDSGDLQQAIDLYQETIQRFPDFALAYHQTAWAYFLSNEKSAAVLTIEKAGELLPQPPVWYLERAGQIFEWAGEKEKAIQSYRKLLELNGSHPTARQSLDRLTNP